MHCLKNRIYIMPPHLRHRDENGQRKKQLKILDESAREGVGGGEPPPTIGASAIWPSKWCILVDLKT